MANPRKSIFDQAGSYYLRQNYFAYNLRREEVEDLDARKNISDRAKWTWVRLKFVLLKCEEPGWLVENGEPMTIQSLATILRRRQPDTLRKDLEELLQNGILKLHDGFICDPRIVAEEADRRRKAGKSAETSDDFLEDSSETSGKHQKQTSAGADVSNPPNGSGEGSSGDPVSKQTSANSNSTTNSTTKRSTMSSSTVVNSTDTRKDSAPDARESSVTRTTDNSPDFGAFSESRRHAADYWITEELREMFGHLDLQAEVTRWLEKTANTPGWKLTAEKLRKFLALARNDKQRANGAVANPKATPKLDYPAICALVREHEAALRDMPGFEGTDKQKRRQFEAWVRENIGKFNCDMEEFYGVCLGDDIFEFYLIPRHDSEEERDNGIAGANRVAKDKFGNWRKKGSEFLPQPWESDYVPIADAPNPVAQKEEEQREKDRKRIEEANAWDFAERQAIQAERERGRTDAEIAEMYGEFIDLRKFGIVMP